ncbi:MAG: tetratricopeptide repeat protein [Chloroflexi bacterium]|nr:tetratricopeptide repeat protein [Chloroflexota bacterium]
MNDVPPPPLAAEVNERELLAMARMLRRGRGTFVLAFARCNIPAQRERLVSTLRDVLAPLNVAISEVTLSGLQADIYAELTAVSTNANGDPLFVYGLESVMPSEDPYRALAQLNERRGRYQGLARPLVFWVAEYVYRLIAEKAPDFWGWRSGVYEFVSEEGIARETYQREMAVPYMQMTGLALAEKEARIRLLMGLLDDYRGDDRETRSARSNVLLKLGQLHEELGDYEQAERLYRESLKTAEELGDRHGFAVTQGSLGHLARVRGDYEEAERLYRESLKTFEELGDRRGVAVTQGSLADLARLRGDYEQAERLFAASLKMLDERSKNSATGAGWP